MSSLMGNNFYINQLVLVQNYTKKMRKLATRQDEDYTTGCLLGYKYVQNHYSLTSIDFSRQK